MSRVVTFVALAAGVAAIAIFSALLLREPTGLLLLEGDRGHIDVHKPSLRSNECSASFGFAACGEFRVVLGQFALASLSNQRHDTIMVMSDRLSLDDIRLSRWGVDLDIDALSKESRRTSVGSALALWDDDLRAHVAPDRFELDGGAPAVATSWPMLGHMTLADLRDGGQRKWLTLNAEPLVDGGLFELVVSEHDALIGDYDKWVWPPPE